MTARDTTYRNPPMSRRAVIVLAVIGLILSLFLQIVGLIQTSHLLEHAHRQQALRTAELLVPGVEEALMVDSLYRLPHLLGSASSANPDLAYAVVCGPTGEALAVQGVSELSADFASHLRKHSTPGPDPRIFNVKTEAGTLLHLVRPLRSGTVGYMHLGVRWAPVDAALRQACLNMLVAMVSGLLLCTLGAWFIYQRLTQPIAALALAARRVGEGQLDTRVPERPDADDEASLLAATFNQMTEKLQQHVRAIEGSRAALADEKERIQAILDSMQQSVIVATDDHRIVYSNRAAHALWSEADFSPGTYEQVHAQRPQLLTAFADVATGKSPQKRMAMEVHNRSLAVVLAPVRGENEHLLGIVEITTDVTEQIEAERMLAHTEKLHVVGQLAAGVAHEINSPLDGAIEASRIIEQNAGDATKVLRFARAQRDGLERIGGIVRTLLRYSRKRPEGKRAPVEVGRLLAETAGLMGHRLTKRKAKVRFPAAEQTRYMLLGDDLELVQVIVNLLNNALDATPEESEILIEVAANAKHVDIAIIDGGPGIPPEVAPLFTPFFTTKEVGKGTGLGLAISRNIVQEHGGEIRVENRSAPWGACFTIRLPRYQSTK